MLNSGTGVSRLRPHGERAQSKKSCTAVFVVACFPGLSLFSNPEHSRRVEMQPPHRMERWLRFWRWLKHTATVNDQELDNLFLNRIPADRPLLAVGFHGHHEDGGLDESFVLVAARLRTPLKNSCMWPVVACFHGCFAEKIRQQNNLRQNNFCWGHTCKQLVSCS